MATNTWDETVPAATRLRSLGDDDIRQFKLDIRERLATEHVHSDGTAITAGNFNEARHKLSSLNLLGYKKGLRIEQTSYASSGNITIKEGLQIEINGDMCYVNSNISLPFSALSGSSNVLYYIYVSSPGHESEITVSNLSYSTTNIPSWSDSKKGWYFNTLRCIGHFTVTVSYMYPFIQTSNLYTYINYITLLSYGTATTWTAISLSSVLPVYAGCKLVCMYAYDSNNGIVNFSYGGSSNGTYYSRIYNSFITSSVEGQIITFMNNFNTYYLVPSGVSASLSLYLQQFNLDDSL